MASRSRSRSPLHSEFNDRDSPTPSHASDVSAISNISKFSKKYSLRLDNVPKSWERLDVHNYVNRHTDSVDKAIAEDIAHITIKYGTGIFLDCAMQFKTEHMRNLAFDMLKKTSEKVNGRKIFVHKVGASRNRSRSPLHSEFNGSNDRYSPTPSHASDVSAISNISKFSKKYSLRLDNVPKSWERLDVHNYVNRHTDSVDKAIAEDIAHITIKYGTGIFLDCAVQFKTEHMRNLAFDMLKKTSEKVNGRKIFVHKVGASRNRSRSPLHSEFNDRDSPTPSHASDVSAISNISKFSKKYSLRLDNVPKSWERLDVHNYVNRHTDSVDKAIAEDIAHITIKYGTGIFLDCAMQFKTEHMRNLAFDMLKKTSEKVNGRKIFVHKVGAIRNRSRSPLHSKIDASIDQASPTPSLASEVSATSKRYNLKISNVPNSWNWRDVLGYVKKHANSIDEAIAEDIAYIPTKKGPGLFLDCSVEFKTEHMRNLAFEVLKKTNDKVNGKKLYAYKTGDKMFNALKESSQRKKDPSQRKKDPSQRKKDPSQRKKDPSLLIEDNETYGLNTEKLKQLGITPPLTGKVFVRCLPNDCQKSKIRTLFSMAGTVVYLHIIKKILYNYAIVEYDHPVEAVQAISMFHNQEMFGNKIRCSMINIKNKTWVERMPTLGPGLGPDGTPMKGIRISLEIKKIKGEIMSEFNKMQESVDELKSLAISFIKAQEVRRVNTPTQATPNPLTQATPNPLTQATPNPLTQATPNPLTQATPNPLTQATPNPQNTANPMETLCNLLTNQFQPTQLLQSLVQPINSIGMETIRTLLQNMTGSNNMNMQDMHSLNPNMQSNPNMQGSTNQGNTNMQGLNTQGGNMQSVPFMQSGQQIPNVQTDFTNMLNMQPFGLNQQMNTGFGDQQHNSNTDRLEGAWNTRAMVVFQNLPTSVTQITLQSKMREVGEVKFIRMTAPGRALVSFFTDQDADKCISLFNQCKVDGQIIGVQKM